MGHVSASKEFLPEAGADQAPRLIAPVRLRALRLRPWAVAAAWVLAVIAAFAVYLELARTRAVNSDGAGNALQAWDMLHGNLLLHGWSLSDVSFYTTELPQYMLVELVRGPVMEAAKTGFTGRLVYSCIGWPVLYVVR
jgi:hypothetical protein